jgi:predicted acetyltransferase
MDVEIRTIEPSEFEAYMRVFEGAFSGPLADGELELLRGLTEFDRSHVAVEGTTFVGAATANGFRMTVPGGGEVPVGGVTGVGVLPTHRRRGVNTALMARQLADIRARGEVAAALYASEAGIYGRFGYGVATWNGSIDIETRRSAFVVPSAVSGRTSLLERSEALPRMRAIHEAIRPARPGAVALDERWFDFHLWQQESERKDEPYFFAIHEAEGGGDDAYAVYHVKHEWPDSMPTLELKVQDLQALTPAASAQMWRFLMSIDLVHRVTARARPIDETLLHMLVEPRRLNLKVRDGMFLRLLDLPGAMAARRFTGDGRVVLEVADGFMPELEGRYELAVEDGRGGCGITSDDADLACSVVELGAAYLGGVSFGQLARAGRVRELKDGALAVADTIFASDLAPWCPLGF